MRRHRSDGASQAADMPLKLKWSDCPPAASSVWKLCLHVEQKLSGVGGDEAPAARSM